MPISFYEKFSMPEKGNFLSFQWSNRFPLWFFGLDFSFMDGWILVRNKDKLFTSKSDLSHKSIIYEQVLWMADINKINSWWFLLTYFSWCWLLFCFNVTWFYILLVNLFFILGSVSQASDEVLQIMQTNFVSFKWRHNPK